MTKQWRRTALLLPVLAVVYAGGVSAQTNGQVTGSADLGWRSFFQRPNALEMAKFEEYRDMSPGPFLQNLQIEFLPGDKQMTSWEVGATNALRRDQTFFARTSRPGLFDLRLGWDQIPHTYSTDGQIIAGAATSSPFTLPSSLTRTLADTTAWKNNAQYLDPIRNEWNVGRASLALTPGESNDLKLEYTRIGKSGERPMGMAFGSPGNNQREILEPVDQTINDLRVSESYARRRYQLQFSYDLNAFHNADAAVIAANPLAGANTATAGAANGRSALAPSNLAQTFSFAGGASLPLRVRVNGAVTYSVRSQNAAFIPMTDNTAITDPRQTIMPASLQGDIHTILGNLTATAHPIEDVTLTGHYRLFKYEDRTPAITAADMPIEIVNDRSISVLDTGEVARDPLPFQRQNAGIDLGWGPSELVNLRASLGWERWDRYNIGPRNVRTNNEYTPRLTLDLAPTDWAQLRGSISHSRRRGTQYEDDTERADFRRFDEADRDANRGDLSLQLTPNARWSVGVDYGRGTEDFPTDATNPNPLGVRKDDNTLLSGNLGWTPTARVNLFASYTREVYNLQQHSRYGEPSLPNNPTYDWIADSKEFVETYGVGANATLIARKLDLEFRYDRSNGISALHSMNPTTPSGGTASQNANATAVNYPDITHSWNPIRISLRYQLSPNWSGTVGYDFENFQNNDFRTNGVIPGTTFWEGRATTVDPSGDVILGNDLRPYRASYLTFTIGFRPGLRQTESPILSVAQ